MEVQGSPQCAREAPSFLFRTLPVWVKHTHHDALGLRAALGKTCLLVPGQCAVCGLY